MSHTANGHRGLAKYPNTLDVPSLSRADIATQCLGVYESPLATLGYKQVSLI